MPSTFLVHPRSFLWTARGLIQPHEWGRREMVLGVDSDGESRMEAAACVGVVRDRGFNLALADGGAAFVPEGAGLYTSRGIRDPAASVGSNIELVSSEPLYRCLTPTGEFSRTSELGEGLTTPSMAFLLGIQDDRRTLLGDHVTFRCASSEFAERIFREVRTIDYGAGVHTRQNSIIVTSRTVMALLSRNLGRIPPSEVRGSSTLLRSFFTGWFGDDLSTGADEEDLIRYWITSDRDEDLRFVFSAARALSLAPRKLTPHRVSGVVTGSTLSFARGETRSALSEPPSTLITPPKTYVHLQSVARVTSNAIRLKAESRDENWSPVVEVFPMHDPEPTQ
jgi:hypothetical protein